MNNQVYIHYGVTNYDPTKFVEIKNKDYPYIQKPDGGLWASRIDANFGWKDWCENEEFKLECLKSHFEFKLSDGAKVLEIYDYGDIAEFVHIFKSVDNPRLNILDKEMIDFEKIKEAGYDAVELCRAYFPVLDKMWDLMYGWDCESIVILNKDIIEEINND